MRPSSVIMGLWLFWVLSWLAAMFWSNRTEKRADFSAEAGYRVVLILGGFLLFTRTRGYADVLRLWDIGWTGAWICAVLVALGFAFCWWARIHLGRLWSGSVTRKTDHHIVDGGPYALVRHPIYTGLLLSVFATAAAKGTVLGIAGAIVIAAGFWMKARLEERWLSQELGAEAYAAYRRRVPMLIPFGAKNRQA